MALAIDKEAERLCAILQQENCVEALMQFIKLANQKKQQPKQIINRPVQLYNRCTAVHLAASKGLWECLEVLLKNGGDPNAVSSETDLRQTPLHHAALNGRARCLQILLEHGAAMDRENARHETALDMVKGKPRCEKILEQATAKIKIPNRTQEEERQVEELHRLASEGSTEKFRQLYETLPEHRRDLSTRWNDLSQKTLLTRASIASSMEIVTYILTRSPREPLPCLSNGETPLLIAAQTGNMSLAWLLLEHSPGLLFKPTEGSKITPLHVACYSGDLDMVRLQLRCAQMSVKKGLKVSLNQRDMEGQTPFFCACYKGHQAVVEQLLEFVRDNSPLVELDVNLPLYDSRRTPLHAVTERRALDIARVLVQHPAININAEAKPSRKVLALLLECLERRGKEEEGEGPGVGTEGLQSSTEASNRPNSSRASNNSTPVLPSTPSCASPSPMIGGGEAPIGEREEPGRGDKSIEATPENAKRPSRAASMSDMRPSVGVYFTESGNVEVQPLDPSKSNQDLGQVLMTPLAEACITMTTAFKTAADMVHLYLEHGARDLNGIACRIALLLGRSGVAREILSYHCQATLPGATADLCLKWSNKKLPQINPKWFQESASPFHPMFVNEEGDTVCIQPEMTSVWDWGLVTAVELQKNSLREVPSALFRLKNIRTIDLTHNRIVALPSADGQEPEVGVVEWDCPRLETLVLSENLLTSLPTCVWGLTSLSSLYASHNQIETIACPNDSVHLSQTLETIELSFNNMATIPEFLFELPSLKRVALNNNRLVSLPDSVWESSTLKELNVSFNSLCVLSSGSKAAPTPPSHESTNAHKFVVGPTEKRLIARVGVRVPPKPPGSSGEDCLLEAICPLEEKEELCWSNYLAPGSERSEHSSLSKLDISCNKFLRFPEALACLAPNLTELDVSSNDFVYTEVHLCLIPQTLQKLTAKQCLIEWIGHDPVTLKERHGTSLKACCHTLNADLPCEHRSHHQLPFLTTLILQKNRLQRFALSLSGWAGGEEGGGEEGNGGGGSSVLSSTLDLFYPVLGGLDLSYNDLRGTFTRDIRFQFHLKWIKLGDNPLLERLPMEFGYLKNTRQFTELSIDNLPSLIDPPKEYQSLNFSNLNHLLSYMRARLKKSVYYRTIKLFLIGREERGKSTLLRRLKGLPEQQMDRTVGIDIADWEYPEASSLHRQESVRYLLWDFAGQDVYSTTHQCFYSRRSLYLALFRLTDGEAGVKELEPWLRNVQLRAPGCPVIIVGTHLDRVSSQRAQELVLFSSQYYQSTSTYPKVLSVLPVSATQKNIFVKNNIETLRKYIYHVSCHLQVSGQDGISLEYKKDMPENDPKALFQQQVPKSFVDLQVRIRDEVVATTSTGDSPPIMDDEQFQGRFGDVFEDRDDLQEAVYFLHLQGTLLHFDELGLRNIYFLDPQWLAKLMADVINPNATSNLSIKNGIGKVAELFDTRQVNKQLKENYIQLLQKFEVALKLNNTHVIVPSLMPLTAPYPPSRDPLPEDFLPLRRVWLSKFILDGFWPRLICRVAVDKHITKTLDSVSGRTTVQNGSGDLDVPILNWVIWRTGCVYAYEGQTLLAVTQENNGGSSLPDGMACKLEGGVRVELTVYVSAVKSMMGMDENSLCVAKATQLLVMISQHITSLVTDWFPGMLLGAQEPKAYIPCWKCVAQKSLNDEMRAAYSTAAGILWAPGHPVHLFDADECVVPAVREEKLECPVHGELDLKVMASDLRFLDIEGDAEGTLSILTNELLGKGGYGFVSKGELITHEGRSHGVAVKVFMQSSMELNTVSQSELKKYTTDPKQLVFSYQQIRREVSFLSNLNNAYLTQLCGVKMDPCMCLLLELAPQKNLRHHLKLYKERGQSLEPFTLKVTIKQIVEALDYLHGQQVVHLDVKSSNVLVWHFPPPTTNRNQRLLQAGDVYVKLADYGISQLSTGSMIKVVNNPVGTPGYMAPEMFGGVREVSAEKIDIFAFGMTVYEMLSLRVPFDDVKAVIKRNHEVKNGGRPTLKGKEIRTPIIAQDLMALCWDQEPEKRPKMRHIKEWLLMPEFELLRSEISLESVKTISCACVCRVTPEQEETGEERGGDPQATPNPLDPASDMMCLRSSTGMEQDSACFEPYILPVQTSDRSSTETHTKNLPPQSDSLPPLQSNQPFRSSSQIWLCGRDQRKGMVQIFKYYDSQPDTYLLTGYLSNVDEISALCPVKNMMWMGTDSGSLVVCHAPSLKIMHTFPAKAGGTIFDIVHVGEASTVVVTTQRGEVWCFQDHPAPGGLQIEQTLTATDGAYRLVKVVIRGGPVQVWGSMDNNAIFLMEWGGGGAGKEAWKKVPLPRCDSGNPKTVLLSCVAHSSFVDSSGSDCDFVWMAYRNRSVVVCWDARHKCQLTTHTLDCSKVLSADRYKQQVSDSAPPPDKCESLAAYGRKLFVGTTGGCVLVVDAERGVVNSILGWHVGKVRTLLVMPRQTEPCICAEVHFGEEGGEEEETVGEKEEEGEDPTDNPHKMRNPSDPDACVIVSVGNGRRKLMVAKQLSAQQYGRTLSARIEDLYLLTWKS